VPWSFSARLHPTFAIGSGSSRPFLVGGVLGYNYRNPENELLYGGRLGYRVVDALSGYLRIETLVELVWGSEGTNPGSIAVALDLGNTIRFAIRGGPDIDNDRGFIEVAAGLNLSALLRSPPDPAALTLPRLPPNPQFRDFLRSLARRVLLADMTVTVPSNGGTKSLVDCRLVRQYERFWMTWNDSPPQTLAAFENALRRVNLDLFANSLTAGPLGIIPRATRDHNERNNTPILPEGQTVDALMGFIREAVDEAFESQLEEL
jgi:hypothetical protein